MWFVSRRGSSALRRARDPRDWTDLVRSTPCAVFLRNWTISSSLTPGGKGHTTGICSSLRSAARTTLAPCGSGNGKPSPDCGGSLVWPDSKGIAQFPRSGRQSSPSVATSLDRVFSTGELAVRHREREQKKWVAAHAFFDVGHQMAFATTLMTTPLIDWLYPSK
jgi:hypothetical protein